MSGSLFHSMFHVKRRLLQFSLPRGTWADITPRARRPAGYPCAHHPRRTHGRPETRRALRDGVRPHSPRSRAPPCDPHRGVIHRGHIGTKRGERTRVAPVLGAGATPRAVMRTQSRLRSPGGWWMFHVKHPPARRYARRMTVWRCAPSPYDSDTNPRSATKSCTSLRS